MLFPDRLEPRRLYIIRHSDTDWTESHRHTGSTDIALNERGRTHALLLAKRLAGMVFAKVYMSPLGRVRETCALAGFHAHAQVIGDLTEWNMGDDEGLTTAQIRTRRPDWEMFRDGPSGGESLAQVGERAEHFVTRVQMNGDGGDCLAFASGQIIRCIAASWLGLPLRSARLFCVDTCSVGVLTFDHSELEPVVSLWNDIGHLAAPHDSKGSGP